MMITKRIVDADEKKREKKRTAGRTMTTNETLSEDPEIDKLLQL